MSSGSLLMGLLVSGIGSGYFMYGRKQQHLVALLSGIVLIVLPWAVENPWALAFGGGIAAAAPFFVRL